jgi:hypothetical protein
VDALAKVHPTAVLMAAVALELWAKAALVAKIVIAHTTANFFTDYSESLNSCMLESRIDSRSTLSSSIGPQAKVSARIPSLDGLRAVSIVMVLICHEIATMPSWLRHFGRDASPSTCCAVSWLPKRHGCWWRSRHCA